VSLLLAPDCVQLFAPDAADAHGWVLPGADPVWHGPGNLQALAGGSDPQAAAGGGHGPYDPAAAPAAVLYLPGDALVADGDVAEVGGRAWVLSQVRYVADPLGNGIGCWVASAAATGSWDRGAA
jgi:hypothetical protein